MSGRPAIGVAAVGEAVVGEVGLPGLVRLGGLEADVGGAWPFPRFGGDQAGPGQVAADRGPRHRLPVVVTQVPGDCFRPGVQALAGQFLAEADDQFDGGGVDRGR